MLAGARSKESWACRGEEAGFRAGLDPQPDTAVFRWRRGGMTDVDPAGRPAIMGRIPPGGRKRDNPTDNEIT